MRFGEYLSSLTKPELENFIENCNFSEEEEIIFHMLSKKKSLTEISMCRSSSLSTVNRRVRCIRQKVVRVSGNNY